MNREKKILIHIDVDSPLKLLNFYQITGVTFTQDQLEFFYKIAFERALDFFSKHNLKATFFVVGDELENSIPIRNIISDTFTAGHEIENHTYSHPYGLAELSRNEAIDEIIRCNQIVENITNQKPNGFRSPGYSINSALINELERLGFKYDSSGFWSIMNPILSMSHKILFKNGLTNSGFGEVTYRLKQQPYYPDKHNWLNEGEKRSIIELPLPRVNFTNLPYYHNFNLWAPQSLTSFSTKFIDKPLLIYLFHIIEFVDLNDDIPPALAMHPNLKLKFKEKLNLSDTIIRRLLNRYSALKTRDYINAMV